MTKDRADLDALIKPAAAIKSTDRFLLLLLLSSSPSPPSSPSSPAPSPSLSLPPSLSLSSISSEAVPEPLPTAVASAPLKPQPEPTKAATPGRQEAQAVHLTIGLYKEVGMYKTAKFWLANRGFVNNLCLTKKPQVSIIVVVQAGVRHGPGGRHPGPGGNSHRQAGGGLISVTPVNISILTSVTISTSSSTTTSPPVPMGLRPGPRG